MGLNQRFNESFCGFLGLHSTSVKSSRSESATEIITERIRDKVAAAKRKGMHTGGIPPMGYVSDSATHKLVVKEDEAATVRRIYADYLRLGSARDVAAGLEPTVSAPASSPAAGDA